jgi:hypothetical protein
LYCIQEGEGCRRRDGKEEAQLKRVEEISKYILFDFIAYLFLL